MGRLLQLVEVVEQYLEANDVEGLRRFIAEYKARLIEEARARSIAYGRARARVVKPISLSGGVACFRVCDLALAFSRATLRRLSLYEALEGGPEG